MIRGLQTFLTGRDVPAMNENAISNVLVDVDFLEDEFQRIGRPHLTSVFTELRSVFERLFIIRPLKLTIPCVDYIDCSF